MYGNTNSFNIIWFEASLVVSVLGIGAGGHGFDSRHAQMTLMSLESSTSEAIV